MFKKCIALLACLALGACATQSFQINGAVDAAPTEDVTQHFFVHGIGQRKTADAAQICGGADKVVRVETETTFLNGLLGIVSWGLYTPRDARVYCKN